MPLGGKRTKAHPAPAGGTNAECLGLAGPGVRTGGIVHLPQALKQYPNELSLYHRVSSRNANQAGRRREKLKEKTQAVLRQLHALTDRDVRGIFQGVEEGKMSKPRPTLKAAAAWAVKHDLILVAVDLSRFIRAEEFDGSDGTKLEVWPSRQAFARLRACTGCLLATIEDPLMTESERRSKATKLTGNAGRPRTLTDAQVEEMFDALQYLCLDGSGRWRWGPCSIREVANHFGVGVATVVRAAHRLAPNGKTYEQNALEKAQAMGLLRIGEDGSFSPPDPGEWNGGRG
jgi:hypothetical protein